jgi:hypothetical protein
MLTDLRSAFRQVFKSPGFAFMAIATLAIAIDSPSLRMKSATMNAESLGSSSRAGFSGLAETIIFPAPKKFAMAMAPSPAREARALPRANNATLIIC